MARVLSIFFQRLPVEYREKKGLTQLLRWAYHFSPLIALDRAPSRTYQNDPRFCGLHIEVSGCTRLFGGEHSLLARILCDLGRFGISARACIAPSLGAAWAISRYGGSSSSVLSFRETPEQLAMLPLAALRIEQKTIAALTELNIRKIGHLLSIPSSALKARFPQEVVLKLHQALGSIQEPLETIRFSPMLTVTRSLSGEGGGGVCVVEVVQFHAKQLLEELLQRCAEEHCVVTEIVLSLSFIDAPSLTRSCSTTIPSNDFLHLWRLLRQLLETSPIELGVQEIKLYSPFQELLQARHSSFLPEQEEQQESKEVAQLLDTLYQRLGEQRVLCLAVEESHIPERSFSYIPKSHARKDLTVKQLVHIGRPSVLYPHPRPIRAMAVLPDTPPFWLLWNGKRHTLRNSIGPERISPEWWGKDATLCRSRDYFRVQLEDGLWLWIYRELQPDALEKNIWFLHGMWA